MALFLQDGRLFYRRAFRIFSPLSAVSYRQYTTPSPIKHQIAVKTDHVNTERLQAPVKHICEMPGPRQLPFVGSFLSMVIDKDFKRDKLNVYWQKLKDTYGDVVRVDFPGIGKFVLLFNPEDAQHLSRITMQHPHRSGGNAIKKIREEAVDNYFGKNPGILPANGEEWYRLRSRFQAPMMKPKNITAYLPQMDQVALEFLKRIADYQKQLGEMPSEFLTEINKWAFESICTVALNRRMGCLEPNLASDSEAMTMIRMASNMLEGLNQTELGAHVWKYIPTPAYLKMKRSHDKFMQIADTHIRQTEADLKSKDPESVEDLTLMETLLLSPGLTRKDVVTLILDMMFAGVDTTSSTVAFTLYLLAKNPDVQTKLQKEIDAVITDHQGPLTANHLGKMSYLKAVVREAMRVYPLAPGTIRTLPEDTVFGGYLVPKGFNIGVWNQFIANDKRLFSKVNEFIPERWQRDRPLGPIHAFASQPFGFGTRICLGRRIAEQEMYTLIARCMQRYTIDYKYQDMELKTRMVTIPAIPLRFNFTERR